MAKDKLVILLGSIILIIAAFMGGMSYGKQLAYQKLMTTTPPLQTIPEPTAQDLPAVSPITAPDSGNNSSAVAPQAPNSYSSINGTYNIYSDGLMPDTLCFFTDTASGKILTGKAQEESICFKNQTDARKLLKIDSAGKLGYPACDLITGAAIISISNYTPNPKLGDTTGGATLNSVSKVVREPTCSRGGANSY